MSHTKIISKRSNLSIIIPTAGCSKRLKKGPKALLQISSEKLIQRQINVLSKLYPSADIIVVVGYGSEKIYEFLPKKVRTVENELYDITNVVRSISLGLRASNTENALIVYGDMVFNRKTLGVLTEESSLIINPTGKEDCVGLNTDKNRVTHISYAAEKKWGQIIYLAKKELDLFKKIVFDRKNDKLFGFEALNICIDMWGEFIPIVANGPLVELDTLSDLIKLKLYEDKI